MATIRPEDTRQTLEILEKTFSALTLEQGKGEGEEFFEKAKLTEKQEKKPLGSTRNTTSEKSPFSRSPL
jgi:hypothetical protein